MTAEGSDMKSAREFDDFARSLFDIGAFKLGEFKLKSGIVSPFYFDLRGLISYPRILREMAGFYIERCGGIEFTRIAGIPFTGLPIAVAVSLEAHYPMIFGRREEKSYGVRRQVEGTYDEGDRVLVMDDTITDGGSKLEYVEILRNNALAVHDILVFLDREQGGRRNMEQAGIRLHSVCTISRLLDSLLRTNSIDESRYGTIREFIFGK